jgi:hypothetical protein
MALEGRTQGETRAGKMVGERRGVAAGVRRKWRESRASGGRGVGAAVAAEVRYYAFVACRGGMHCRGGDNGRMREVMRACSQLI